MRTSARAGTSPKNQTGAARGCWKGSDSGHIESAAQTRCRCRILVLLLRLSLYPFIHFCNAQYCEHSLEYDYHHREQYRQ